MTNSDVLVCMSLLLYGQFILLSTWHWAMGRWKLVGLKFPVKDFSKRKSCQSGWSMDSHVACGTMTSLMMSRRRWAMARRMFYGKCILNSCCGFKKVARVTSMFSASSRWPPIISRHHVRCFFLDAPNYPWFRERTFRGVRTQEPQHASYWNPVRFLKSG